MGFNDEFDRNPDLFPDDDDWQDLTGDDANDDDDDWLSQLEDDDDQPAGSADSADDSGLDWISALEANDDEDEDGTPDWLAATGSLSDTEDEPESEPSWLPDTGMLSGDGEDEADNAPNWLPDTGMLVGDDEADDAAPTWLADTGMLVGASDDDEPDASPDWLADSGEFDAVDPEGLSDDDDFAFDDKPVSDTAGADDELELPDWMTGMPIPEAEEDSNTDDEDWLSAFDEDADKITADDEPEPIAEVTDEDWLSELEDVDEITTNDEPEPIAEVTDENWLSELEDADEITVDDEPEPIAEAPDWLDDVDVPPVVSDTSNFDNLFDDLPDTAEVESDYVAYDDDDDDELSPENGDTAQQLNTGYLRQMGLDGEDDADDQEDWFAEPASELSELDDVEWLDELDVDDDEPEPVADDDMGDAFPVDDVTQADVTPDEDDELAAMLAEIEAADDSPFGAEEDDAIDLDELIASLDEADTEADEVDLDDLLAELSNEPDESPAPTIDVLDDLLGYDDDQEDDFAAVLDSIDAEQFSPAHDDETFDLDAVFDAYEEDDAHPVGTDIQAVPADDDFLDEFDTEIDDEPLAEPDYGLERVDLSGLIDAEAGEIGEASAVAEVVGQYKDRPVEELDDRLKALRQGGLTLSAPSESDPASKQRLASVVPNVDETLTPIKVSSGVATAAVASDLVVTPDQQKHVKLLQSIATGRADASTLETDALPAVRGRRPLTAGGITRIAVMLILLAAVIAPFLIDNLRVGDLPPVVFPAGGDASAAYVRVQALNADDRVLIAAEYGASVAGELDEHTRNIIAHVLSRGAVPVLVSSDPVGLLRVSAIADEIAGVDNRNETYYPIQYIPAGVVGLRQLTTGTSGFFAVDSQGVDNGLTVNSLDEFQLAVLITDEVETVRSWMEQVAPMTDLPFVVATAYSGMPLTVPYADSVASIVGLLVGYQDAYTYNSMLRGVQPTAEATVEPTATPTEESTATPTDEPTATPTDVIVTEEAVEPALVTEEADDATEATDAPTATDEPTDEPTEASTATDAPTATNSPTPRPTNTPAPTSTPTETPVPIVQVATNDTESRLNVREVPDGIVVGVIEPGETVLVLDEDGDWLQVELPDETIGWVYAPLVEIEEIPQTELEERQTSSGAAVRVAWNWRKTARRLIVAPRQAPAETTAEPEATAEPEPTEPTENAIVAPIERGDVRWHAMTFGVLVAAVLIALGNVFYLLRWLVRKGR